MQRGDDGPAGEPRASPDGIAVGPVTAWIVDHVVDVAAPLSFRQIAGGRSNLTFEMRDTRGRGLLLRRPPTGMVLTSAHDVAREHTIMSALADSDVPVPRMLALCTDHAVTGADFLVSEFVEGMVPRSAASVEAAWEPAAAHRLGLRYPRLLATLHHVDPDAVGLGDLGRRHGYLERQIRRWSGQWEQSRTRELPLVTQVARRLEASVPPQQRVAIVHGDFRPDNTIVRDDGHVAAVVDWELSTLGDPLADLGALLCYWVERDEPPLHGLPAATAAHGFPTREEVTRAYAEASGLDVSRVGVYQAFAYWRLAVILEGVLARYEGGVMGADAPGDADGMRAAVERLVAAADSTLRTSDA